MSSPAQKPVRSDFAARLRSGTRADHAHAQSLPFLRTLLAGELEADAYAVMLGQHYFVYEMLEQAAEAMRGDVVAGPFISDRLLRSAHLVTDLHYYLGPDWREVIKPSAATERYRERLREVCFTWPGGFVAHHYARCLADLSGGRLIRSAMRRSLDLPDDRGFAFLTFDDVPSSAGVRNAYRLLLDTAGWDELEQRRIIAEVRLAYHLGEEVFADLGERLPPRIPRQRR
ncbi:biliverdin-producing heme oxygenase [Saccharopolyspora sp. NFXS83]|uniref:biliverdin-producing heme oxygenase n=1 Tax=Saccharopolyspora sp. NFXS83 TaxID=2993560 RepID=UPI00224A6B19|nr:biliverdin-producing heme oxygenase [Saccharopolyspora sp. NFXS83]MCX2729865.1 biliverdin-producing heme oxygenase [Saccharopolyspora sp. NFXS83]